MKKNLLLCLVISTLTYTLKLNAQATTSMKDEDALMEAYKDSQILAIAAGNHSTKWKFSLVEKLLDQVKGDQNLKYIILESFNEFAPAMQKTSLPSVDYLQSLKSLEKNLRDALCGSIEFAYGVGPFLQKVRTLNIDREENPILLTAIDGVKLNRDLYWPLSTFNFDYDRITMDTAACSPNPSYSFLSPLYISSANRENDTARNFINLFNSLKPNEKVIVIYHTAHLVPEIHSCMATMNESDVSHWSNSVSPLSWYQRVVEIQPNIRNKSKLVLLDEKDGQYSSDGNFKFLAQYAASLPNESRVAISGEDLDLYSANATGYDILQRSSFLVNYMGHSDRNDFSHKDLFDYYIWEKRSDDFFFPNPKVSLPSICGG